MVQVTYPGVYVTEIPSDVHAIAGVETSVAAFLGQTSKGPRKRAVHLCSIADYRRVFGPRHRSSDLACAVQQFFRSGGRKCYVVRLAPKAGLGDELIRTALHALDSVDQFNLMIIPADRDIPAAQHQLLWGPASAYCDQRRAMLLIDAPPDWTTASGRPDVAAARVDALRERVIKKAAAVFYPRVACGARRWIGPTGMIAGLMARTDASAGVWKAPARVEADRHAPIDLEVSLTARQQSLLSALGVNALRRSTTGAVRCGARTLAGDHEASEWKYVPVRRLTIFLEASIDRGTQWVVFEPNSEPTWAKVRASLTAFLMGLFRQGAFQGTTPGDAFYVKCDADTTPQNDRDMGIVTIEVGFAPLKPAEFVVLKIRHRPASRLKPLDRRNRPAR